MERLGETIRIRRKLMNLTQKELADRAGVGMNFVYQLEKNKPTVQFDLTCRVLRELGLGIELTEIPESERVVKSHPRPSLPWD
jgi:y4mF family transcriptional regulator